MIHKLESAGLGYHVQADESEDRLGMIDFPLEKILVLNLSSILKLLKKVNVIIFKNSLRISMEQMQILTGLSSRHI